jgi:tRNA(Ile)-lysidine synthase
VLPALEAEINPRASDALARLATEAAELDDLVRGLAGEAFERAFDRDNSSPETEIRLVTDRLRPYHATIRRVTIRFAYERLRGSRRDLSRAHLGAVDRLLFGVGSISLPGGVRAVGEQGRIRLLAPLAETGIVRWDPLPLVPPGEMDLGASRVRLRTFIEAPPPRLPRLDEREVALFDVDRLAGSLVVRPWRVADRFRPLGMAGRQKLSDLFTNHRVARSDRPRVPILADGEGILWVIGHRRSDRAQVGPDTRRVLRVVATEIPSEMR